MAHTTFMNSTSTCGTHISAPSSSDSMVCLDHVAFTCFLSGPSASPPPHLCFSPTLALHALHVICLCLWCFCPTPCSLTISTTLHCTSTAFTLSNSSCITFSTA